MTIFFYIKPILCQVYIYIHGHEFIMFPALNSDESVAFV